MRVAVLWTGLSGYMNACLKELAGREGVELFVSHEAQKTVAPFDERQFAWMQNRLVWRTFADLNSLDQRLQDFSPEIVVLPSWHITPYRRAAKLLAGKCWRVMIMDNCWRATVKQRIGTWIAPYFVRPIADVAWIPGERQAVFAKRLGFAQRAILRGSFSCDQDAFDAAYRARKAEQRGAPRAFLFVGRLAPEKGVDVLVKAYAQYRSKAKDPWPLICCGTGPMQPILEGQAGIRVEGFVQPDQMPAMMASAGCLVLPSVFEPWALVVHEATSAGLAVLASDKVGAAVHLVQPEYNGYIFDPKDVDALAGLMLRMSAMDDRQLGAMSEASHLLSRQYSPRMWADVLLRSVEKQHK